MNEPRFTEYEQAEPIMEPVAEPEAAPEAIPEPEPEVEEAEVEALPDETPEDHKKRKGGFQRKLEKERKAAEDARAEAAYLRGKLEALHPQAETAPTHVEDQDAPPSQDSFETYEQYLVAVTRWGVRQELKQEHEKAKVNATKNAWDTQEALAKSRYDDYNDIADLQVLSPTPAMAQAIIEMESGADVLYWLGKHPAENARIKTLSPLAAAVALGEIKSKLAKPDVRAQPSQAPPPIKPVVPMGHGPVVTKSTRFEVY